MPNRIFLQIAFVSVSLTGFTQVMPEAFLALLPDIPGTACSMKAAERDQYLNRVDSLSELINLELSKRHDNGSAGEEKINPQMVNDLIKQYGLSEEDLQKIKSGKEMSDAETQALIDKILQNSADMSSDEVKNVSKMSKEGQKAWAEGYSREVIADQKANPQKSVESPGREC